MGKVIALASMSLDGYMALRSYNNFEEPAKSTSTEG